nr:hypothetical protein B0A51_13995 [Rachicladosporium sp. CCFEE 5018]
MSQEDIDAELLALGGGGSDSESDDEGQIDATQMIPDRSPTPEPVVKASVEKHDDAPRRGVAQKIRPKRGAKAAAARRRQQSVEEDGEASDPASPRSPSLDAMQQSSSEIDAPGSPAADDDAPLYPLEGKFLSTKDRSEILDLPEIEREEILAERAQLVTRRQQDLQLKRAIAATRQKADGHHKRKAAAAEIDDDNTRKTSRPRVEKAGRTALDDYKLAREQKGAAKNRSDNRRDRRDDRSASLSDRDADGESEVEWAREPEAAPKMDDPPANLRELDRARVGRTNFSHYCFTPDFDARIKGCYVRVCIGPDREHPGRNAYRMAQIKGFTEGKPYTLTAANGKPFLTDVYALVSQGSSSKPYPFLACSDSHLTAPEFERYIATLRKENLRPPTRSQVARKLDDIKAIIDHQWSDVDIGARLARIRDLAKKYDPSNIFAQSRAKLQDRKALAEESGDNEELSRVEAELAALTDKEAAASQASPSKTNSIAASKKSTTEQDRLARLNIQTRMDNRDAVHKALVEEKRKRDRARAAAHKEAERLKAEEAEKLTNGGSLKVPGLGDLFGESDGSRAGTPRAGTPQPGGVKKLNGRVVRKGKFGQVGGRSKMDDEVIASMDLGIDIEI